MPFFRRKRIDFRRNREIETNVWKHVLWGVLAILAVILFFVALWNVTRLPRFTLSAVHISGGETIPHELVREQVTKALRGSYLRIVPYTFAYTYPHEEILNAIYTIPRIKDVSLERTSETELTVTFGEYIPFALWCLSDEQSAECYFLDAHGYAFSLAPPLRGGALTRHVIEGTERLEERQAFTKEEFSSVQFFLGALEERLGLRITDIIHTKNGDLEYRVSGGGTLLVDGVHDVEKTLTNLSTILESKEFRHLEPGNFKYIDLRFGNKIFVNEELGSTTDETLPE